MEILNTNNWMPYVFEEIVRQVDSSIEKDFSIEKTILLTHWHLTELRFRPNNSQAQQEPTGNQRSESLLSFKLDHLVNLALKNASIDLIRFDSKQLVKWSPPGPGFSLNLKDLGRRIVYHELSQLASIDKKLSQNAAGWLKTYWSDVNPLRGI